MKPVSGRDFCKALERAGWIFDRTKGSHRIDVKPNVPYHISVPVHGGKPLATGTQATLMKQAGLTDADL